MGTPSRQRTVELLVEEHYAALYRYAYRLSGLANDAEDLTQETFLKAQAHLEQLRDPARAKPWLFSILRNAYLHRIRSDRQERRVPIEEIGDVAEPPPEPLQPVDPERLQEVLNELPEVFRTTIILYYFKGFSYRDIAEAMDLPIGTVMSRLARGKAHLRCRLLPAALQAGSVSDEFGRANGPGRATDGL